MYCNRTNTERCKWSDRLGKCFDQVTSAFLSTFFTQTDCKITGYKPSPSLALAFDPLQQREKGLSVFIMWSIALTSPFLHTASDQKLEPEKSGGMATTKASCKHPHNKITELLRPSVDTDHVQMLAELKYFISILTQDTMVVNASYIRRWQREQSGPEVDEIENSIPRVIIMWDTFSALLHTGCPSKEDRPLCGTLLVPSFHVPLCGTLLVPSFIQAVPAKRTDHNCRKCGTH